MSKHKKTISRYLETLVDDARDLLAATSDSAGDKVKDARHRLSHALDSGKDIFDNVRDRAGKGVRYADDTLHENPYAPIAIAFILGALLTLLLTRKGDE